MKIAICEANICEAIIAARTGGNIHCGIIATESMSLAELALKFGLIFAADTYRAVDHMQAATIAKRVLHCDLAYDAEIMREPPAQALASRFLNYFEPTGTLYYTNGD